jgi:prepilin-type N-terminal cleavage/methylation domain-containing protein
MRATYYQRRSRRSFTIVELLVVVTIIGILVSLITAGAYRAIVHAKRTRIALEAKQLEMACLTYRERFGELPPDGTEAEAAIRRHLQRMFPLWGGAATRDISGLNPGTALVFFLGGPQDATTGRPIGFSPNPRDPFETTTTEGRIGPFFEFDRARLNGGLYYPPGVETTSPSGMYVYFRSENGSYAGKTWSGGNTPVTVTPVADSRITGSPWANPDSCQILCGGLDGTMGTGTDLATGSDYNAARWDDQANFLEGTFEDARD